MPGLMVLLSTIFLMYSPRWLPGRAALTACRSAWALATTFSASQLILAMPSWILPLMSILNEILPPASSATALSGSGVTVPFLGFGMRPLGPKILAALAILGIMSGV